MVFFFLKSSFYRLWSLLARSVNLWLPLIRCWWIIFLICCSSSHEGAHRMLLGTELQDYDQVTMKDYDSTFSKTDRGPVLAQTPLWPPTLLYSLNNILVAITSAHEIMAGGHNSLTLTFYFSGLFTIAMYSQPSTSLGCLKHITFWFGNKDSVTFTAMPTFSKC